MRAAILGGLAAGLLVLAGCSSSSSGGDEPAMPAGGNVITRAEIEAANVPSAYEVVRKLRYTWLQTRVRSPSGGDPVRVYVDGVIQSGVDELRRLEPSIVAELRYLNPGDATTRFGTGHTAGAILVFTVR